MKFFLTTCAAVLCAATVSAEVIRSDVKGISSIQEDLRDAVNKVRADYSKPPLCLNAKLAAASQEHAYDMATGGWVASAGSSGSTPTQRATDQKFNTTGVAEIVGAGYESVDAAMNDWMASPAYSMYVLGDYKYMGAGYAVNNDQLYKLFWVIDFAKVATGEVCA